MVDTSMTPEQAAGDASAGGFRNPRRRGRPEVPRSRSACWSPAAISTDAQPGFDQRTSEPIVNFRFNSTGARKFAEATQENVGKPFAIVLDNKVISAPVIREPILGGSGQISGSFTVQSANDLADPAARRRAAGAADRHRGAHGRARPRPGFDQCRRARRLCRRRSGHRLHAGDLRPVRPVRQHRGRHQRRHDLRHAVAAQRHADAARHRRHRADRRHRGRFQRADLRAHPRGGARRPHRDQRRSTPASRARSPPFSIPTSPPSSPPRCCSISAPARCAASP